MLKNIVSFYFQKFLFNSINEKTKLKLVKYNKNLQNKLGIELINYKFFSRKYILYETKEKGKEYNSDNDLLYEGEFLHGVRNGKGKEYNIFSGVLIFEGEFIKGIKNGKGKDYYRNGNIKFEGEYINGKRWSGKIYGIKNNVISELKNGKGILKELDENGKLKFEGEYLNGEKNGKGKEYGWSGKLTFGGEYLNGKKNGKVKEYYDNGKLKFEGEYINGNKNGKGTQYIGNGTIDFQGEFYNGLKWNGINYDDNNNMICNLKNGKGFIKRYYDKGKLMYEYEYVNGLRNGKCKEYFYNGNLKSECEYLNGEKNGNAKEYYENGKPKFEGKYLNGKRNDKGK